MDYELLQKLASNAFEDDKKVVEAETALWAAASELVKAEYTMEREIALTSLRLTTAGAIDGKNAETRKLQLDALIEQEPVVVDLRAKLRVRDDAKTSAGFSLGYRKAEARYSRALLDAALAVVKASSAPQPSETAPVAYREYGRDKQFKS